MVDFRECDRSALAHAWYQATDDTPQDRTYYARLVARCERCGTKRIYGLDRYGDIVYRDYQHPEGWKERWSGFGGERPSGDDIRLMMTEKRVETRRTRKR